MISILILASVVYAAQGDISQLSNEIFDARDLQTSGDSRTLTLSNDHEISVGFHAKGTGDDKTASGPVVYKEKLVKNYSNSAQMQSGKHATVAQKQSQLDHQTKSDYFAVPVGEGSGEMPENRPFSPVFDMDEFGTNAQNMYRYPPTGPAMPVNTHPSMPVNTHPSMPNPNQCPSKLPPANQEAPRGPSPLMMMLYLMSMRRAMGDLPFGDQYNPMMDLARNSANNFPQSPFQPQNPQNQRFLPPNPFFDQNKQFDPTTMNAPMGREDAMLMQPRSQSFPIPSQEIVKNEISNSQISQDYLKLNEAINRHNKNSEILAAALKKQTENERILKESLQRNDISILELPLQQHLKNRNVLQEAIRKHTENKKTLQVAIAEKTGQAPQSPAMNSVVKSPNVQPNPMEFGGVPLEQAPPVQKPMQKRSLRKMQTNYGEN